MKYIGIIVNPDKPAAIEQAAIIAGMIKKRGGSIFFEDSAAVLIDDEFPVFSLESINREMEAIIVLGGDGTIMRTFRKMNRKEIPLLGINLGGLGFLTEVRLDKAEEALCDLLEDNLQVQKRNTLKGLVRRDGGTREFSPAVNDIVIGKGGLARVIQMEAFVDSKYLTSYMADGLIIATPTGSTAYSLSAQGPIISPETDVFLLNPICPHTLTNRPIIIDGKRSVKIKIITAPEGTCLTMDGQIGMSLKAGDEVIVRKGDHELHLLTAPGLSFYGILRRKLSWGGRTHY